MSLISHARRSPGPVVEFPYLQDRGTP